MQTTINILSVLAAAATAVVLTGCSSTGSMTCSEYGDLDASGRQSALNSLLREHDLETLDAFNQIGLEENVDQFCGISTSFGDDVEPATQNLDRPLDESTDWDSQYW